MNIAAGTSSKAPIILDQGTLLDTPVPGAIEYDGNNLYLTTNSGRQVIGAQGDTGPQGAMGPIGPAGPAGASGGGGGGASASGVAGSVQFSNGSDLNSDATNLFWDDSNNRLGIGTNTPSKELEVNGDIQINNVLVFDEEYDNSNSGTAITIDWNNGNKQEITLTDNCTLSFTAPGGIANLLIKLTQDGTGSRSVTWPASVKWPSGVSPTLSTSPGTYDIVSCYYDDTNYNCVGNLNFQ